MGAITTLRLARRRWRVRRPASTSPFTPRLSWPLSWPITAVRSLKVIALAPTWLITTHSKSDRPSSWRTERTPTRRITPRRLNILGASSR
ncbi:MAG: hypothetical protein WDM92_08730 [Caulobacteraceae bacterium]